MNLFCHIPIGGVPVEELDVTIAQLLARHFVLKSAVSRISLRVEDAEVHAPLEFDNQGFLHLCNYNSFAKNLAHAVKSSSLENLEFLHHLLILSKVLIATNYDCEHSLFSGYQCTDRGQILHEVCLGLDSFEPYLALQKLQCFFEGWNCVTKNSI